MTKVDFQHYFKALAIIQRKKIFGWGPVDIDCKLNGNKVVTKCRVNLTHVSIKLFEFVGSKGMMDEFERELFIPVILELNEQLQAIYPGLAVISITTEFYKMSVEESSKSNIFLLNMDVESLLEQIAI